MSKILVIVPAYNEQDNISKVIDTISHSALSPDLLVVNDCSTDKTKSILDSRKVNYVDLKLNLGIGGGVQTGYKYAREKGYDIAVQFDGDGQHDIAYLEKMIKPLLDGTADYVIGSRYLTKEGFQSTFLRRLGIQFLSILIKVCTGQNIRDVTSGYRAVNQKCIDLFAKEYAQDYPEPEAIVLASYYGARIKEIPVIMHERQGGQSSISGFKSLYYMLKVSLAILLLKISLRKEH